MEYGIREHAVLYALLAKYTILNTDKTTGEDLIKSFTGIYGMKRGERMRRNTLNDGKPLDISSFLIYGEWAGRPGENRSVLDCRQEETVSEVSLCAWFNTWKQYDLLPYGQYYCHFIDLAICRGYAGTFTLDVKEALGKGDSRCIFCWSQGADQKRISEEKEKNGNKWILPFSFHCKELLAAYREAVTDDQLRNRVLEQTKEEFFRLFPEADHSVFR